MFLVSLKRVFVKRKNVVVHSDEISVHDEALESVSMCNISNGISDFSKNKHILVYTLRNKSKLRGMALHKLAALEFQVKFQIKFLCLSASIGQEDERDVVFLQEVDDISLHVDDRPPTVDDAVDVENKSYVPKGEGDFGGVCAVVVKGVSEDPIASTSAIDLVSNLLSWSVGVSMIALRAALICSESFAQLQGSIKCLQCRAVRWRGLDLLTPQGKNIFCCSDIFA